MQISKQQTAFIKGVAILMMLFHHLFAFPARLDPSIVVIHLSERIHIEQQIAAFCRICVPVFLFLSGYGFALSKGKSIGGLVKKALSLYSQVWFVALLFVPFGVLFFNQDGRYTLTLSSLLLNLTGLDTSWNWEWWFLILYVAYLFTYPIMLRLPSVLLLIGSLLAMVGGTWFFWHFNQIWYLRDLAWYGMWLLPFTSGLVIGRHSGQISGWLQQRMAERWLMVLSVGYILGTYIVLDHYGFRNMGLCLIVVPLIYCLLQGYQRAGSWLRQLMFSLGNRSGFMWLTHSFYCYYFIQPWIYAPRFTLAIFALLVALAWLTSVVLSWLYNLLTRPRPPMTPSSQSPA